jgi:uncharacterized protein YraI
VKYIFLAAAFTLATIASANADTTCVVNSPDGELNVRDLTQNGPGRVTGVVKNGYTVTMRDFYFLKGQSWARVVDGKTKTRVVGWVFKDYLNCNGGSASTNNNDYTVVPVGNLGPEILVMQSAQNWHRQRATDSLHGTWDRCVLVQR